LLLLEDEGVSLIRDFGENRQVIATAASPRGDQRHVCDEEAK
jgi:hypothetical protein